MKLLLIIVVCLFSTVFAYGTFPIDFKGNTLSIEEYEKLELCQSKWCIEDANRILLEMSYNNSLDPCDNFVEFACGTFYKERAHNERYEYVGFMTNYMKRNDEKRSKVLKAHIKENDVKAVKVTKNFYQRCVSSNYIENQSRKEILEFLASFGKFPNQISNWTEKDLNFTKLEIETKLEYFLNFKITHCPSPKDGVEILCLVPEYIYSWSRYSLTNLLYTAKDVKEMFKLLGIPSDNVDEVLKEIENQPLDFPDALPIQPEQLDSSFFGEIKDLKTELGSLGQSEWLEVFNSQLPEWLRVTETDNILIISYINFFNQVKANRNVNKRLLAYVVLIDILYDYRHLFEVYPFDNKEYKTAIKTPERFELCNRLLDKFMPIAVNAMFARRYLTKDSKEAVHKLMKIAIDDFEFETNDSEPELSSRIKRIQIFAGYPNDMIEDSFLNKLYEKLNLNGNETLFESFKAIFRYQKFINMLELSNDDWKTLKVDSETGGNVFSCKLVSYKYLYCPASAIQYPAFHENRSQFYNMAMILPEINKALNEISTSFYIKQEQDYASRSYRKWAQLNGREPNLGGFLLTNEEMFWVALAVKKCQKGKNGSNYFQWFPSDEFIRTFNCSVTPEEEEEELTSEYFADATTIDYHLE